MTNFILGIIIVILSYAVGKRCIRLINIQISSTIENLLFSIGLGFGIISYSIFFLGIFGILYKWIIWILPIGIIVFLFNEIRSFFISILQVCIVNRNLIYNTWSGLQWKHRQLWFDTCFENFEWFNNRLLTHYYCLCL